MKLEPVYLVAPKRVPSMPTRRAFLIAGGTFVLGGGLGGACGYAMGAGVPVDANAKASDGGAPGDGELKPSGDVELDELRRLAVKAPIEELLERRQVFVELVRRSYRKDPVLWRGMHRLATALVRDSSIPQRRVFARVMAQVIEQADQGVASALVPLVPDLRGIK